MKSRLRAPSPALVISLIALFVALGGTSLAAGRVIASKHKDAKADTKLIKRLAPSLSVKHAENATNATNATHATSADSATVASGLPALTWSDLTLQNGWAPTPATTYGPEGLQYTKDHEGFVHLRGTLLGGSATNALATTLPAGFRPSDGAWVVLGETNGAFNPFPENAWIDVDGNIRIYGGTGANSSFVSFEGVEFYSG
jgi:hypothetical protein